VWLVRTYSNSFDVSTEVSKDAHARVTCHSSAFRRTLVERIKIHGHNFGVMRSTGGVDIMNTSGAIANGAVEEQNTVITLLGTTKSVCNQEC